MLLALVLGTLIGSAYGFYATQKAEIETLAAHTILLDTALAEYGSETQPIRAGLLQAITRVYDTVWRRAGDYPEAGSAEEFLPGFRALDIAVAWLNPTTPMQRNCCRRSRSMSGFSSKRG